MGRMRNELRNAASHIDLFFKHECKIVKIAHNLYRKITIFMSKSSVYFSAPLLLDRAPSLRVFWRRHRMKGAPPGAIGVVNPSGWMLAACFTEFMKHFIKFHSVIPSFDNHGSHISIETTNLAKDNDVILLTLSPHCSHKLQPLDRSVYGPFKTFHNQAANGFIVTHPGKPITSYDVAELVGQAGKF